MIFLRSAEPDSFSVARGAIGPAARFRADLDLRPTRIGTLAVQRENGAWAYLEEGERALIQELSSPGGATAGELAARGGCHAASLSAYLDQLWQRGLVSADGRYAIAGDERRDRIAQQAQSVFSLILELSSGCNLGCQYCYLGQAEPSTWVSQRREDALRAVDWAMTRAAETTAIDLGEISVAGGLWRELVEEIRARAGRLGKDVHLFIQTNGTTLDDAAVEFLARHRVSVGISLDGGREAHDAARPFRGGRGTHAHVMKALARLKRARVQHWAVATIGAHNIADPEGLIDYLISLGLPDYVLKPILPFGDARSSWRHVGVPPRMYAGFLGRAVRRALSHSIDRLDLTTRQFFWRALGGARGWSKSCTSRQCGCGENRLVLEAEGRWTPCPRFGEYAGPPGAPPPDGIGAPKLDLPEWSRQLPQACGACPWQTHCGGGCALSGEDDPHCPSYMANFEAIFDEVIPTLIEGSRPAPATLGSLERVRVSLPAPDAGARRPSALAGQGNAS